MMVGISILTRFRSEMKPNVYKVGDTGISYSYLRREDGKWVTIRSFGHATIVLRSFASESSARRDAERERDLARGMLGKRKPA